jgi:pantoate--beta-alanine ligase
MRELERDLPDAAAHSTRGAELPALAVIGRGRAGGALFASAERAGLAAEHAGREEAVAACRRAEVALLCVPDAAIAEACEAIAQAVPPLRLVGHVSGATGLDALKPARRRGAEVFSLHPLQTIPDSDTDLTGAPCAVSASSQEALTFAARLGERLGMRPFHVPEDARATYHAAASIASNLLVALEESASDLLSRAGIRDARELLAPLVLRSAANWADRGPRALTGPIARGDRETVERHLTALREAAPDLVPLYEALAERAWSIAAGATARSGMRIVRSKKELREALEPARRADRTIGLVPTMGALHEGHASLLRAARRQCEVVVMSLFVNPAQFAPGEDLESYPRDETRDAEAARAEGVDLLYAPSADEVYPPGFATGVEVGGGLTDVLCGAPESRGSGHFRGVTTVVAKLLNAVAPDVAFFGQKDAQQAIVIRRMARDLDYPVRIEVLPTVREPDGLAMSSRNAYLSAEERRRATALVRALRAAEKAAAAGETRPEAALARAREELEKAGIEPEYLEARDAEDLTPARSLSNGRPVLVAVAARVGKARLIDNTVIGG